MSAQFVHLSCHTEYSMIDGLVRIKPWVKTVAAANMPACAMTDHCNLFGLVKFYRAAQAAGVKPIVGAELWIDNGDASMHIYSDDRFFNRFNNHLIFRKKLCDFVRFKVEHFLFDSSCKEKGSSN